MITSFIDTLSFPLPCRKDEFSVSVGHFRSIFSVLTLFLCVYFQAESAREQNFNDENTVLCNRLNGDSPPHQSATAQQQQQHLHLLHPLLQHHHQNHLARVAFGRLIGNGVSVIQKVGKAGAVSGLPYRPPPSPPAPSDRLPVKSEPDLGADKAEEEEEGEKGPKRLPPALVPISHHHQHAKAKPSR